MNILNLLTCLGLLSTSPDTLTRYPIETLHLPRLTETIQVDGKLEPAWESAFEFPEFVQTRGQQFGAPARYATQCRGFISGNKLYLAFVCHEPEMDSLTTRSAFWDDPDITYDDRVEIFIDPDHDHRSYYHLAVNAAGVQFDEAIFQRYPKTRTDERNPNWNCFWKARTTVEGQQWTAEIEIDLSEWIDAVGHHPTWGFNVGRARRPQPAMERGASAQAPLQHAEYSAWKYTRDGIWETVSNFFEPTEFGDLVWEKQTVAVKSLAFRNASFVYGGKHVPPTQVGSNPFKLTFDRPVSSKEDVYVRLTTVSENGKSWTNTQPVSAGQAVFSGQYVVHQSGEVKFTVEVLAGAGQKPVYYTSYVLTVPPFIEYNLTDIYTKTAETPAAVPFRLKVDDSTLAEATLEIKLFDTNQLITQQRFDQLINASSSGQLNLRGVDRLKDGTYTLEALLLHNQTLDTISHFSQPFTHHPPVVDQKFEALTGDYQYGGLAGHAVQVAFPNGQRFVFWEKASYVPWWDVDQIALSYGYTESAGLSTQGCAEALQDRECRFSHVEVVEQSAARIVVHWRYALTDAHYKIHNNEWVDEYYYFYPDAVGVRTVNLWVNQVPKHTYEFFEIMIASPPSLPDSAMFDGAVAQLSSLDQKQRYTTQEIGNRGRDFYEKLIQSNTDLLVDVNLRHRMNPFAVISFRDTINQGTRDKLPTLGHAVDYANTSNRGHWPASEYAVDGYNLIGNHRPTHGNMGSVFKTVDPEKNLNQFKVLIGIDQDNGDTKFDQGRSWLNPATVHSSSFQGYDIEQRAYVFGAAEGDSISFEFQPNQNPVLNPVFVFAGTGQKEIQSLEVGGGRIPEADYKTGTTKEDGLVVFLEGKITSKQFIKITF